MGDKMRTILILIALAIVSAAITAQVSTTTSRTDLPVYERSGYQIEVTNATKVCYYSDDNCVGWVCLNVTKDGLETEHCFETFLPIQRTEVLNRIGEQLTQYEKDRDELRGVTITTTEEPIRTATR